MSHLMNRSVMGFGARVNDDIILISRWIIPWSLRVIMMLFWRWSSLGFATVFQTLWQIHTWVFFSFLCILVLRRLISVQSLCPSFTGNLLFWDRTGALSLCTVVCTIEGWWWVSKSLYCSVHYRGLVVGLFLLLWLE